MPVIDGVTIYEDWITQKQEAELLDFLPVNAPRPTVKRNTVIRWGESPYSGDTIIPIIPECMRALGEQLVKQNLLEIEPNSISANHYMPGQRMDYHIDNKESGEIISILSLSSEATMLFKNPPNIVIKQILPRSLLQMRGQARWQWSHAIEPVKEGRWSIVFRNSTK